MRWLFEASDFDPRAQHVITGLQIAPDQTLTRREIRVNVFKGHIPAADLDGIMERLIEQSIIRVHEEPTKGRSVQRWSLNHPASKAF